MACLKRGRRVAILAGERRQRGERRGFKSLAVARLAKNRFAQTRQSVFNFLVAGPLQAVGERFG